MKILMRASQNPFDNFNAFDTLLTDKLWANIGNLLFPYSLYRNLFSENTSIETIAGIPHPDEAAEINDNYDMLLLPFANAFRPSFISQLNRWTGRPVKSIVNIGSEEAAERLNNYLGHLIRKNNKMQKELDRMKNIRMER